MTPQLLHQAHTIADAVGAIVSVPLLATMLVVVRYIDQIKHTAEDTQKVLVSFMHDHENRLREAEGKVAVMWDGHERRHA